MNARYQYLGGIGGITQMSIGDDGQVTIEGSGLDLSGIDFGARVSGEVVTAARTTAVAQLAT